MLDAKSYHRVRADERLDSSRQYPLSDTKDANVAAAGAMSSLDYITNQDDKGCACENCSSRPRTRTKESPRFQDYCLDYDEEKRTPLLDHFYFLCDEVVYGYALKERKWGMFINC